MPIANHSSKPAPQAFPRFLNPRGQAYHANFPRIPLFLQRNSFCESQKHPVSAPAARSLPLNCKKVRFLNSYPPLTPRQSPRRKRFRVSALGALPRDTFRTRAPERTAQRNKKIYRPKTEGGIFFPRINFYERKRNYNGRHKIFTPNAVHVTLSTKLSIATPRNIPAGYYTAGIFKIQAQGRIPCGKAPCPWNSFKIGRNANHRPIAVIAATRRT